jgi:hypothetical protein
MPITAPIPDNSPSCGEDIFALHPTSPFLIPNKPGFSPKVEMHNTNIELNLQPDLVPYIQSAALPVAVEKN